MNKKDYSKSRIVFKNAPKEGTKKRIFTELSEHYTNVSKSYKLKLKKFDIIFELAEDLAFERRENPKQVAKLRNELIREYYYYKDSFLKMYMSKQFSEKYGRHSIQKQFAQARKMAILARFKNLRKVNGSEKIPININGEEKEVSIRTLFILYNQGKITKDYLYDRVNYIHANILTKYNTKEYRQRDGNAEFSRFASR